MKDVYAYVESCSRDGEFNLIVRAEVEFALASLKPVTFERVSMDAVKMALPRSGLARALRELAEVDASLGYRTSPLMVHHNIYGQDEYAHSAIGRNYVSFNIGVARVRALFSGSLLGDANAKAALVDLFVHEKAHLVRQWEGDAGKDHDLKFYGIKARLKYAFLRSKTEPFAKVFSIRTSAMPAPLTFVRKMRRLGVGAGLEGSGFGAGI